MRVQAILESGRNRVLLAAETEAEMRALGVIGEDVVAQVRVTHEGHPSNQRIRAVEVTLAPAPVKADLA